MFYALTYTTPAEHDLPVTLEGYVGTEFIDHIVLWALRAAYEPKDRSQCYWVKWNYSITGFRGALYLPDSIEPTKKISNEILDFLVFRWSNPEKELTFEEAGSLTFEPISAAEFCKNLARIETNVISFEDYFNRENPHRKIHPAEIPLTDSLDS